VKKETKSKSFVVRITPSDMSYLDETREKDYEISRNEAVRRGIRMYIDDYASRIKKRRLK